MLWSNLRDHKDSTALTEVLQAYDPIWVTDGSSTEVMRVVKQHQDRAGKLIELKDSQAVVFDGDAHQIDEYTV